MSTRAEKTRLASARQTMPAASPWNTCTGLVGVNFDAIYVNDPWTPAWTYTEIAGTGRSVGGTVYKLSKYQTAAFDATDPQDEGKLAILINLQASTDPDLLDKYILIGVTVTAADLSVPVDVLCLSIE